MIVAHISETIEPEWRRVEPVRVGRIPEKLGTPDRYVMVSEGESHLLRLDVYAYRPDCFVFQNAIIWCNHVFVGLGSHVHAVSLKDYSVVTINLDAYYGYMYPTADYLLVASGERLFRIEPNRSISWRSKVIAIDGVVVSNPGPPIIFGEGEWDPPGGWKPFLLLSSNGEVVQGLSDTLETL